MLHCSFSPLWKQSRFFLSLLLFFFCSFVFCLFAFFRKLVKLLSSSALSMVPLVIIHNEYNVGRDMSSGMCNQESASLPKCVSAMLSQKKMRVGWGWGGCWWGWGWEGSVAKNVVGVPRGCFGNNVRRRPYDFFFNSWLTSGLPLVTPKISFKLSTRVAPVAYVAPASNLCLLLTDSSLERRRMLET